MIPPDMDQRYGSRVRVALLGPLFDDGIEIVVGRQYIKIPHGLTARTMAVYALENLRFVDRQHSVELEKQDGRWRLRVEGDDVLNIAYLTSDEMKRLAYQILGET